MPPSPRSPALRLLVALLAVAPAVAVAQVFVYPRQPGKAQVKNFDFEWSHVDLAFPVGPGAADGGFSMVTGRPIVRSDTEAAPDGGTPDAGVVAEAGDGGLDGGPGGGLAQAPADGGVTGPARRQSYVRPIPSGTGQVRLYFYERERQIAQRATTLIQNSYERLVEGFRYVPAQTFPYILYSSYQEFLQTNLSPVQEGTLGFTSPQDLKLSLPYFGDDRLFELVSTHELAHQFTIQKVRTVTGASGILGDPLGRMPLWFIEGLAEYSAQGGMDPEAEMLVRDLVLNPDPMRGYFLGDFFQQGPGNFLWIYKMGQARCAFLDETYGHGFVHKVLDESWRLVGRGPLSGMDFVQLLERLTGEKQTVISSRFERWLKTRAFRNYLGSHQDVPDLVPLEGTPEFTDALSASPDGRLLMMRAVEPLTGQSRLVLFDPEAPGEQFTVVVDGVPGVESLGLVFGRNFDLGNQRLTFLAERSSRDVLFVQDVRSSREDVTSPDGGLPTRDVDVDLGRRREFHLSDHGIVAAFSPSLSPDDAQVAFVGLVEDGTRDLFALEVETGKVRRLTDNPYTERQVHWGKGGILFTSDATERRRFNLFRIQPDAIDPPERITVEDRDHQDPQELADGRIFFTAYTQDGRADLHEAQDGRIVRRTDIATGLFDPSPAQDGSLWAMLHRNGRRQAVRIAPEQLGERAVTQMGQPGEAPLLARTPLVGSVPYTPFAWENVEMGPIFGFGGAAPGGIYGQVFASANDRLRNHAALLQVSVFGSWDLTDGVLFYLNNESRTTWGGGLFQSLRFRTDRTTTGSFSFVNYERFYGASALARYPFNTFSFVEGELGLGGATYFVTAFDKELLANPDFRRDWFGPGAENIGNGNLYQAWRNRIGGARPQGEVSLRLGYDTIRYDYLAGPIDGSAVLLESITDWQPTTRQLFGNLRLDAERFFPLFGRVHLLTRMGAGASYGGYFARDYFLSSYDTIRGINFGDERWLVGPHYLFSTAELQVPLNQLVAVAFLSDVEGIAGVDFGGVGTSARNLWDKRVLNFVAGVNLGLGPLLIRLHFARPFNIHAPAGMPVNEGAWVTNFSIGMAGMPGFLGSSASSSRQVRQAARGMMPRTWDF